MVEQAENFDDVFGSTEEERRIFDRFPSRFPAKFKDTRNGFGTDVYLRNSSAGGARITTKERLYLNDSVTLEVELSDGKSPMTMRGEVVWVRYKDAEMWDIGLKFYKIVLMDLWRPYTLTENGSSV